MSKRRLEEEVGGIVTKNYLLSLHEFYELFIT